MFWSKGKDAGDAVYTQADLDTFTHILYLDVPAETIAERCKNDKLRRDRGDLSAGHLRKWQDTEKEELRRLCRKHHILFLLVSPEMLNTDRVPRMLLDFRVHSEECNRTLTKAKLDEVIAAGPCKLETMMVFDADKTLAAEDAGALFWNKIVGQGDPLKVLFSSELKYSYTAFRQAMLRYEEAFDDKDFDALCDEVASEVTLRPDILRLLRPSTDRPHVGAVVVTCGLRRVWEKVLKNAGLSDTIAVIGGGRITDSFVVTEEVKGALVDHLREFHHMYVWAFGDSPLDLAMLRKADRAIVVVGEEESRSKSMEEALRHAIETDGLKGHQLLLPSSTSPRLDTTDRPLIQIDGSKGVEALASRHLNFIHATDKQATKVLATMMRNAESRGPALREVHRRVGWYLAMEFVTDVIGVKKYEIPHVQGKKVDGYRLDKEDKTLIVPLMRGGEPMAFGVSDAFPKAMFVHAEVPADIQPQHLDGLTTLVLVDSVVNSGKSVAEFVQYVRTLDAKIRIVIVAGVVQADAVGPGGSLLQALPGHEKLDLVALRKSDNKYAGSGPTDTGHRLFNTTHLP